MIQATSLTAYHHEVKPNLGDRQRLVLDEIKLHYNITNSELANHLNIPINTVTPRVHELRRKGLVIEDCKRTCRVTGRTAIAWKEWKGTLF